MKHFWKKQLPAILLVFVIILGLAPSAAAVKVSLSKSVAPGRDVSLSRSDFRDLFMEAEPNDRLSHLEFTDFPHLDDYGVLYAEKQDGSHITLKESDLEDRWFYYAADEIKFKEDCLLEGLRFLAHEHARTGQFSMTFTMRGIDGNTVQGTLHITIGDKKTGSHEGTKIIYQVPEDETLALSRLDFAELFETYYKDFSYLRFHDADNLDHCGTLYSSTYHNAQNHFYPVKFDESTITEGLFYFSDSAISDNGFSYSLNELTFVPQKNTAGDMVTLDFILYGETSSDQVSGTLIIQIEDSTVPTSNYAGNIRYKSTAGSTVQINANDIARYYAEFFPNDTLQYVLLNGIPSSGALYYNYFNASAYGPSRTQLTTINGANQLFYFSPPSARYHALSELTYIPDGANYCVTIPFTAYGTASRSVTGTILISITTTVVPEVYRAVIRGNMVNFPAPAIHSAVQEATGLSLSGIQLLALPSDGEGSIHVGKDVSRPANITTQYSYASGDYSMSQLWFTPVHSYYTGSMDIPYVALDSRGEAIASGVFALGLVSSIKYFTDISASTWCYKYVVELFDAGVIDGYADDSFKPNNTISYGAALKLIMLAAGYPEQAPTTSNVFSGYLAKAQADGLIPQSDVNLSGPITRLQVAQLAAAALKLDTKNLPSTQAFTDTTDPLVRALNAAGIVEGYFSNGTYAYRPNNTLTRGQVSAIVWRMYHYRK